MKQSEEWEAADALEETVTSIKPVFTAIAEDLEATDQVIMERIWNSNYKNQKEQVYMKEDVAKTLELWSNTKFAASSFGIQSAYIRTV